VDMLSVVAANHLPSSKSSRPAEVFKLATRKRKAMLTSLEALARFRICLTDL
jgi:hypothetical protein